MQQAILTVDLGFGDAGKGSIVDFLTRTHGAHTVVRYNGGAQAGHRVVALVGDRELDHVFSQFGAGTLAGAATHLSRFMLLEPLAMLAEEVHLQSLGVTDAFRRTTIDSQALVITPFQRAVNRLRELARGADRHGSCGMGIGETMVDRLAYGEQVLVAGDLQKRDRLFAKLAFLREVNVQKVVTLLPKLATLEQAHPELDLLLDPAWADWLMSAYGEFMAQAQLVPNAYLATLLARPGTVVFEGAQGVLLDEWVGFHPHTTWSTTTLANAEQLLAEANYQGRVTRMGLTRAYATRHGAGPLVTEEPALTQALPDACNHFGAWQQGFRVGWLDLVLLRYACAVVGPLDSLAVTCLDRLAEWPLLQLCTHYADKQERLTHLPLAPSARDLAHQAHLTATLARCRPCYRTISSPLALVEQLTTELAVPIGLISQGPRADQKQYCA
ncbi:MAG: adenylosuccinate synthetase [Caldilineaceae bacterium]|nr:adenylosuccinate synthetase [Caldilineaceae bacterium]